MAKVYEVQAFYQATGNTSCGDLAGYDDDLDFAARAECVGSGCGFGDRDRCYHYDSQRDARNAVRRLKRVKAPDLRVFQCTNEDEDE